jgi:hypothetical protein
VQVLKQYLSYIQLQTRISARDLYRVQLSSSRETYNNPTILTSRINFLVSPSKEYTSPQDLIPSLYNMSGRSERPAKKVRRVSTDSDASDDGLDMARLGGNVSAPNRAE